MIKNAKKCNIMSGRIGELILILFLVLILFGVGKLPKVMGEMGKGLKAFRDAMNGGTQDINESNLSTPPQSPDKKNEL
jgi:sec-independent protein translocase protein TatA